MEAPHSMLLYSPSFVPAVLEEATIVEAVVITTVDHHK